MVEKLLELAPICDKNTASLLLDKLYLKQLHLMEDKMKCELNVEANINNGSIHLAKSRYIMGQSSVSTARLPHENSPEFSASSLCSSVEEEGVKQIKIIENQAENTVNPLRWFGVLVPQNLHKAQGIFQNTLNFVVECVNIQLQLLDNMSNISLVKRYLNSSNT